MNRFTFTPMNERADYFLSALLNKAMDSGAKSIKETHSGFYLVITFNDESKVKAWNKNKYYAWLNEGVFTYPPQTGGEYTWYYKRPTRATMARLLKIIKNNKLKYEDLKWLHTNKNSLTRKIINRWLKYI